MESTNQKDNHKLIGFVASTFDLLHAGHLLMLRDARKQCDMLIVGLHTDPSIERDWKHKPVETLEERIIRIQACKYIDRAHIYNTEADLYALLKEIKPNMRFLGDEYKGKSFTGDDLPISIVFINRDHNYSSSNLRQRVYEAEHNNHLN